MLEFDNLKETFVSSEKIFDGNLLHIYKDVVELPNGEKATREYFKHMGAVAVVPVTDDGRIVMEKQYRYPAGRVVTEIPAGKINKGETDPLECGKRELEEETGYTADEWIDLGIYQPAMAYCDEVIYLYIAKGLHFKKQKLDEDEFLNVELIPLEKLIEEIMKGNIKDGKTQVALLKTAVFLKKLK